MSMLEREEFSVPSSEELSVLPSEEIIDASVLRAEFNSEKFLEQAQQIRDESAERHQKIIEESAEQRQKSTDEAREMIDQLFVEDQLDDQAAPLPDEADPVIETPAEPVPARSPNLLDRAQNWLKMTPEQRQENKYLGILRNDSPAGEARVAKMVNQAKDQWHQYAQDGLALKEGWCTNPKILAEYCDRRDRQNDILDHFLFDYSANFMLATSSDRVDCSNEDWRKIMAKRTADTFAMTKNASFDYFYTSRRRRADNRVERSYSQLNLGASELLAEDLVADERAVGLITDNYANFLAEGRSLAGAFYGDKVLVDGVWSELASRPQVVEKVLEQVPPAAVAARGDSLLHYFSLNAEAAKSNKSTEFKVLQALGYELDLPKNFKTIVRPGSQERNKLQELGLLTPKKADELCRLYFNNLFTPWRDRSGDSLPLNLELSGQDKIAEAIYEQVAELQHRPEAQAYGDMTELFRKLMPAVTVDLVDGGELQPLADDGQLSEAFLNNFVANLANESMLHRKDQLDFLTKMVRGEANGKQARVAWLAKAQKNHQTSDVMTGLIANAESEDLLAQQLAPNFYDKAPTELLDGLPSQLRYLFDARQASVAQEQGRAMFEQTGFSGLLNFDSELVAAYSDEQGLKPDFYEQMVLQKIYSSEKDNSADSTLQLYELLKANGVDLQTNRALASYSQFVASVDKISILPQIEASKGLEAYFDANGPTAEYYTLLLHSSKAENLRMLERMEQGRPLLNLTQLQYLQFMKDRRFNEATIIKEGNDLSKYFDETGPKPAYWQLKFNSKDWDVITGQPELDSLKLSELQRAIIEEYKAINRMDVGLALKNYVEVNMADLDIEKVRLLGDVLERLANSNSSEVVRLAPDLAKQVLEHDDPFEALDKIENIFIRNHLPIVGKIYQVFKALNPKEGLARKLAKPTVSPILQQNRSGEVINNDLIIFSDLLKAHIGSNNRSLRTYATVLRDSESLLATLDQDQAKWGDLQPDEAKQLKVFFQTCGTLLDYTQKGARESLAPTEEWQDQYAQLRQAFGAKAGEKLTDRMVRMFSLGVSVKNFEQLVAAMDQTVERADQRGRAMAERYARGEKVFKLNQSDLIKGVGASSHIESLLQNGIVAREFLGSASDSDSTPLDTDLSMILERSESISQAIEKTAANSYGPVYFVVHHDQRFSTTRRSPGESDQSVDSRWRTDKLESFYTGHLGNGHYGIRTGFASGEIDFIVCDEQLGASVDRIKLEIAKNGFYIPIVARESEELIFTPEEFDQLRSKMAGLDYYHAPAFEFADRLEEVATILAVENVKANIAEVDQQRQHIQQAVAEIINQAGLDVKEPDGTLGRGLEVVDIGSTGRYTNVRGAGDFDLMVRVDRPDFMRENIRQGLVDALRSGLNHQNLMDNDLINGNLRLKGCSVPGLEALVDIDITFVQKTDKLNFSPDQALSQRLENIKQADETKYYQVLANVEAAKQLLRSAEVYKSARSPDGQGGLGGVGVESWILQNGGSLLEAANSFLQEARGKSFAGFQAAYKIWDFGEDYMLIQNNSYKHSEFVSKNMSEAGYNKMVAALEAFVASVG